MATIGSLNIGFNTDVASLESDMKKASRSVDKTSVNMKKKLGKAQESFRGLAKGISVAAVAMTGYAAATKMALSNITEIKQYANTAGVGIEKFQEFSFALKQFGGDADLTAEFLKELQNRMAEFAMTGTGPAADILERVGISRDRVKQAQGNIDALIDIAIDGYSRLDNATQKTFFLEEIAGGQAGERLRELFDKGSAGLKTLRDRARDTGAVISGELIESADQVNDALNTVGLTAKTAFSKGLIEGFSDQFDNFADAAKDPKLQENMKALGELSAKIAKGVLESAEAMGEFYRKTSTFMNDFGEAVGLGVSDVDTGLSNRVSEIDKQIKQNSDLIPYAIAEERKRLEIVNRELIKERERLMRAINKPAAVKNNLPLPPQVPPPPPDNQNTFGSGDDDKNNSDPFKRTGKKAKETKDNVADLKREIIDTRNEVDVFANSSARSFSEFISGTMTAQDALQSLLSDLQEFLIRQTITAPIKNVLSSSFGAGNFAVQSGNSGAALRAAMDPGLFGPGFAKGGVTNKPSIFGEAGPEAAVPLPDGRRIPVDLNGGAGGVNIEIINNTSQPFTARQQSMNGGRDVRVEIDEMMATNASNPNSRFNRALGHSFGISQNNIKR